jgi:hypothetical protein
MNPVVKLLTIIILSVLPNCGFGRAADKPMTVGVYLGGRISENLENTESGQTARISDDISRAVTITRQLSRNQEGELLFSNSKQHLKMSDDKMLYTDLYISYLQFGGRVLFTNNSPFSSHLGLGIGTTFFTPANSEYDNEIGFSGNISGGVRYQFNRQWALRGDLRVYGTLLNSNGAIFCNNGQCLISLNGEVYVQTELLAGIEYKF